MVPTSASPRPELDAGLAPVGVGDLADRIGHQEAADAEQRDGQSGEACRAGQRDHHQRPDPIGELRAGAQERLRQRKQRGVALDQRRDAAGGRSGDGLMHEWMRGDASTEPSPVVSSVRPVFLSGQQARDWLRTGWISWPSSACQPRPAHAAADRASWLGPPPFGYADFVRCCCDSSGRAATRAGPPLMEAQS